MNDPQSRGTTPYQKGLAPATTVPMGSGSGKSYPNTSYVVPDIEAIMSARGLTVGARHQRRWTSGKANQMVGKQGEGQGDRGPLAIETVSMDWILKFARARELFALAQDRATVFTARAEKLLKQRVEREFRIHRDAEITFGAYGEGLAREKEYINRVGLDNYEVYLSGIDDLNVAMGRFAMFAIPHGRAYLEAQSNDKNIVVEVDELGIYARDAFDFNGPQALGKWRLPNQAELSEVDELPLRAVAPGEWAYMSNYAYVAYRERTGMGEDFLVYSDIRPVKVDGGYSFKFPTPSGIARPPSR